MANKSTIEFINPYASLAQKHKDGLDFVINAITTASPPYTDLSAEELLEIVVDYLQDAYDIADTEVQWLDALTTALANTVNTYLDGSAASTANALGLFSVPVGSLANHMERLEEHTKAARAINGPTASNQLALTLAKADFEYWNTVVNASPLGDWEPYLIGNVAIDTASIPYWIEAAVIGSSSGYNQIKGTDGNVALTHSLTALGGSIIVAAGKVIFGWVAEDENSMQLSGGFSNVIDGKAPNSGRLGTNNYCTNRKSCTNSGCTNSCVNNGCTVESKE
jgi:hypothetical protein